MPFYMGEAEQAFLDAVRNSLWLAALVAVLVGVALGFLFQPAYYRAYEATDSGST